MCFNIITKDSQRTLWMQMELTSKHTYRYKNKSLFLLNNGVFWNIYYQNLIIQNNEVKLDTST